MTEFVSLYEPLRGYFKMPLAELPPELQARVEATFSNSSWDQWTPKQRQDRARDWDRINRPMTAEEQQRVSNHFNEVAALDEEERYWSTREGERASDAKIKRDELKAIRERMAVLDAERCLLRGDDPAVDAPARPMPTETTEERRARLLATFEAEVAEHGTRGAVERTFVKEKALNPKADRSYVGKQIRQARGERRKAGAMAGVAQQLAAGRAGKR
jgi:hypothetical protein